MTMTMPRLGIRIYMLVCAGVAGIVLTSGHFKPRRSVAASAEIVPLELVLLVDTSGSVDYDDYRAQQDGYAEAFRDTAITDQVEEIGGMAVVYIEWDDADSQTVRVPWRLLKTRSDCLSFADSIAALDRVSSGSTMIAPALDFARTQLISNQYLGMRRIIDVSGDGFCKNWDHFVNGADDDDSNSTNYGLPWNDVIDSLPSAVDVVNCIFVGNDSKGLSFYQNVLPLGEDAFSLQANDYSEFQARIREKLLREVSEPIAGAFD